MTMGMLGSFSGCRLNDGMTKRESEPLKDLKERIEQLGPLEISELRGWILALFDVRGYDARYNAP